MMPDYVVLSRPRGRLWVLGRPVCSTAWRGWRLAPTPRAWQVTASSESDRRAGLTHTVSTTFGLPDSINGMIGSLLAWGSGFTYGCLRPAASRSRFTQHSAASRLTAPRRISVGQYRGRDCEHVPFHRSIREATGLGMYLNPGSRFAGILSRS
jgi:hypothetical protein